jgi:hypothetical protein
MQHWVDRRTRLFHFTTIKLYFDGRTFGNNILQFFIFDGESEIEDVGRDFLMFR